MSKQRSSGFVRRKHMVQEQEVPQKKFINTVVLGRVLGNLRGAMVAIGRGFRQYQSKRIPFEGRPKKRETIRGRFEDPEIQRLVNTMTNHQRHLWARAGYPNVAEFLGLKPKPKRRRLAKSVVKKVA